MASIRNSISLQDRMTPVLRSIIKSMDSTLRVMQSLDKQANKGAQSRAYKAAEKDIKRANNQLIKMKNNLSLADRNASKLATTSGRVSRSMSSISGSGFNLVNLASALYILNGIKGVLSDVMAAPDQAMSTMARLGLFNEGKNTKEQLYGGVYETALKTRTGLADTSNLATRILISGAMEGPGAAEGAIGITEIINKALIAGGGTKEENRHSLLQLSQALASGVLQGDELRAIREQTPYLAKILAEGLGKVDDKFIGTTIGDLKQLGRQGELTSDKILKAFWLMKDEVDESFKKMPKTFGQAMVQMNSIWDYFLYTLSQANGPLAKINQAVWKFVDYMSSSEGIQTLQHLADGISVLVDVLLLMVDLIGKAFSWLGDHLNILKAAFIALGVVAIGTAASVALAWLIANWPILLVFAAVAGLVYLFLELGFTAGQIVGFIVGGFMFLAAVVWDVILYIVGLFMYLGGAIWNVLVGIVTVIIWVAQGIVQVFLWAIIGVINMFWTLGLALYTVLAGGKLAVTSFLDGVWMGFFNLANFVLKALSYIAKAIDEVFGSSLNKSVEGWMKNLKNSDLKVKAGLDTEGQAADLAQKWADKEKTIKDMLEGNGKYDGWNITDNMGDIGNIAGGLMVDFGNMPNLDNLFMDPNAAWDKGYGIGNNAGVKIEDMYNNGVMDDFYKNFDLDAMKMGGGNLDNVGSVGSIKSDVNLSDQDVQLLRDIAAKEYLLNLQTITPTANITFGDIREEADVNKILEVIENMVEEQLATSLVVG